MSVDIRHGHKKLQLPFCQQKLLYEGFFYSTVIGTEERRHVIRYISCNIRYRVHVFLLLSFWLFVFVLLQSKLRFCLANK